jgi:dihydrodipicolinate synthase/N-acetylneuraminate lyase
MNRMTQGSLDGVFAVPPLARKAGGTRAIDFEQNSRIVRYIANGGVSRFIYGGNAGKQRHNRPGSGLFRAQVRPMEG